MCVLIPTLYFCLHVSSNTSINLLSLWKEILVWWRCTLCQLIGSDAMARSVRGTLLSLYCLWGTPRHFPNWSHHCSQSTIVVLRIVRCISTTTIRELWKTKVYCSQVLEGTGHARGPHSEVVLGGESMELASRMVEPKVSWVHSLLVNLKHKRNLSLRREKKGHSVSLLPRLPQVF